MDHSAVAYKIGALLTHGLPLPLELAEDTSVLGKHSQQAVSDDQIRWRRVGNEKH
jgi:hypothetical protein